MKYLVAVLLTSVLLNATAQDWAKINTTNEPPTERKLNVGDKIPFTELHNVVNYKKGTLNLSDLKAKLIILDFWSTSCGPCIKFWPSALKLQQEFGSDIQIIPVNSYENTKKVKEFLAKRKRIDGVEMSLPMVCRDSAIWKNFPEHILPKYVWISNGVIGAITSGKEVTTENIRKWIATGPFKMDNLNERKFLSVKPNLPIYVNGNGGERSSDVFLWSSTLTKGQEDVNSMPTIYYNKSDGYGITVTNVPIVYLYGHAYNNRLRDFDYFDFLTMSRVELIVKDSMKYFGDGILGGNTFDYQLISPEPKTRDQLLSMMKQDLDRFFGLQVKWEKRMKKCLVFTMYDSTLATKGKSVAAQLQMRNGKIIADSVGIKDIMTVMEMGTSYYRDCRYPLIDETGYKGLILGLREDSNMVDPETLDRILSKVGLRLKFGMREVDVLVLRE